MTRHTLPLCLCHVVCHKLATCGYLWLPVATCGYLWLPVATCGYLWPCAVPNSGHLCAQDSLQLCPSLITVVPKSVYFIILQSLQCRFYLSAVVIVISRLKSFYVCAQVYGYLCAQVWLPSCPHMWIPVCPKLLLATCAAKYMVTSVNVCGLSVSWLWLCLCLSVVHCVLKHVAASPAEQTCVYFGDFHNDGSIET